ncbi:MAG: N-acetyltransferase family protein [Actinomycetota bacterium]
MAETQTSVYVRPDAIGRGVGRRLYSALFDALENEPLHRAFAGVALPNEPSLRMHRSFGFRQIGTFTEVGWKLGRYWDVTWLEKAL